MKKANIIAAMLVAAIVIVSTIPYAIADTEGAELEFTDFYPASLTYEVGEKLAVGALFYNSGTEIIYDATVCINVVSPNGTYIYDFSYDLCEKEFEPNTERIVHSRFLWQVDENATEGQYTIEAILRYDTEAIQKNTFFYVPEEPVRTEPGLKVISLYSQRISYKPGDDIICVCRVKNERNESVEYYISMCLFDYNGTMVSGGTGSVYTVEAEQREMTKFRFVPRSERGIYTVEVIVWWADKATSKTAKFGVDN
jgi:hypothetical protein